MAQRIYECRREHYQHLKRPDGSPLSEKDSLLLDLCVQWTKNNKVATSTYAYLLDKKFPRQNHPITVKRTFENISLYIKAEFKNLHIIEGEKIRDKIHIERVADFDLKMSIAMQNTEPKCLPYQTQMSTPSNVNVDPPTYIRKITKKITRKIITDLNDHSENQFLNFDVQIEAKEDFVEMPEPQKLECDVEAEVIGLAMDGFCGDVMHSTTTTECAEIPTETAIEAVSETARAMPTETHTQAKMYRYAPTEDRITRIDKNGNEYWGIPLKKYQYSKAMLEEVRLASNKPHFTQERISGLFSYLADKYPDKLIIGGRKGFVEYMTKVVNGEKEYDEANKMISIEEKRRKAQKSMDDMVFNNDKVRYA
jgi:hypothetical protein